MFKSIFMAVLMVFGLSLVSGCSSLSGGGLHPEEFKILTRTAAAVSVSRIIMESDTPGETAQKIYDTSSDAADKLRNGEAFAVDKLGEELRGGIDWDSLTQEEAALINDVIRIVEADVRSRLEGKGESPEDYREELASILDEIAEAASFYLE